jgi:hypothetical protein
MEYMKLAANSDPWDYDGRAVTRYFQPLVVSVALVTCVINIIIFARLHATTLHTSSLGQEVYCQSTDYIRINSQPADTMTSSGDGGLQGRASGFHGGVWPQLYHILGLPLGAE